MKDTIVEDQDYEVWVMLRQVHDVMHRARDKELKRIGISWTQAAVLFIVKAIHIPATPSEISRWFFRQPHTVSELLRRMEKEGLIKRVKDLKRKNQIRVSITKKGEELYLQTRDLKTIHEIMSCLSKEEQDNLRSYLTKLRSKSLTELGVEYELPFP